MSITITPLSPERLGVAGDIEMELRIPYDSDEDRFHLAVSDGTLIAGEYDPDADRFHYQVEIEGAGITRIVDEAITLDWRPEWLTIAVYQPGAAPAPKPMPLPLFETAHGSGVALDCGRIASVKGSQVCHMAHPSG